MKNRKLFTFIALMFCACMAIAQHENCNHGDAPDASYGDFMNGCSSNELYVDDFEWVY